jgi:hypothetical protein
MATARERILVFQPLVPASLEDGRAPFDMRMLGVTHWLADQLGAVGLESVSAVFTRPVNPSNIGTDLLEERDRPTDPIPGVAYELTGSTPPTDAEIRSTLVHHEVRYGVLLSFTTLGGTPQLAVARLFEARRGRPLRCLGRWAFEGDTHSFPAAAHKVFMLVAERLGVTFRPHEWTDIFGTEDPVLASNLLTAIGCYAQCDRGIPLESPQLALRAVLTGVARDHAAAISLLPHLVRVLADSGSAEPAMLRAAIEAAMRSVVVVPDGWDAMLATFGLQDLAPGGERGAGLGDLLN